MSRRCQAPTLIVREPESLVTKLLFEDAVLLDQVLDCALLLTADPADGGQEQGAEREAFVQHTIKISALRVPSGSRLTDGTVRALRVWKASRLWMAYCFCSSVERITSSGMQVGPTSPCRLRATRRLMRAAQPFPGHDLFFPFTGLLESSFAEFERRCNGNGP